MAYVWLSFVSLERERECVYPCLEIDISRKIHEKRNWCSAQLWTLGDWYTEKYSIFTVYILHIIIQSSCITY